MSDSDISRLTGLSSEQVAQRLSTHGPNELPQAEPRTLGKIAWEVAQEPMFQLLVASALVYAVLGDLAEAAMLSCFVAVSVVITLIQERRTERVLETLHDLTSPRALVVRDGVQQRVAGRDVVVGDLLVLGDGDRIAADARLLTCHDLLTDESLLSGESVAVNKSASAIGTEVGEHGMVYAGTVVVSGQGLAEVTATGAQSEIGRIGKTLEQVTPAPTPLFLETRRLVRVFSVTGIALSLAVLVLYGLLRGDWLGGVLAGITLAMSMLPQEFLVILTAFTALGAWRLSRQGVLTRRAATIETLGAATVLCTDKTGTLTQNRMAIAELAVENGQTMQLWRSGDTLHEAFHALLDASVLASEREPVDPMERAIHQLGQAHRNSNGRFEDFELVHEYNLSPELLAMSHVWQVPDQEIHAVAVKGAPEAVARLCRLPVPRLQAVLQCAHGMAQQGLRVLAVARANFEGHDWPATQHGFDFEFLGLVGLSDPVRPGVPEAIRTCREAGIRVVMITGDFAVTARAIAQQAGFSDGGRVLTGQDIESLDEATLRERVKEVDVYARVRPEQKLRIVHALQANGEVVAMTGDGVNDAPSLKAAHIGIAMGQRGTDVAREAADLVLLKDDFASMVGAIQAGRGIFDNLRRAMAFVLAVHVPIAGLSLLPLLAGWPLVFMPIHIAFLELVIDPISAFVFANDQSAPNLMRKPPRDPSAPLFSRRMIFGSLAQGLWVLVVVSLLYAVLLHLGQHTSTARAAAFVALVCASFGLVLANRASSPGQPRQSNTALLAIFGTAGALLGVALLWPAARAMFQFGPVESPLLAVAVVSGTAAPLLWRQAQRWLNGFQR